MRITKGTNGTIKEAFKTGVGLYLGIGILELLRSIVGIVLGYFLIIEGQRRKKKDKESHLSNIFILMGYFFMMGSVGLLGLMFSKDLPFQKNGE